MKHVTSTCVKERIADSFRNNDGAWGIHHCENCVGKEVTRFDIMLLIVKLQWIWRFNHLLYIRFRESSQTSAECHCIYLKNRLVQNLPKLGSVGLSHIIFILIKHFSGTMCPVKRNRGTNFPEETTPIKGFITGSRVLRFLKVSVLSRHGCNLEVVSLVKIWTVEQTSCQTFSWKWEI